MTTNKYKYNYNDLHDVTETHGAFNIQTLRLSKLTKIERFLNKLSAALNVIATDEDSELFKDTEALILKYRDELDKMRLAKANKHYNN